MIALDQPATALKMEWVELAYNQNGDADLAFEEMMTLHQGA